VDTFQQHLIRRAEPATVAMPWYSWLILFGIGGTYLFAIGWQKFMLHNVSIRAAERVYLILLFENFAKERIVCSAEEIAAFLRSTDSTH
jgi:hypothetical protein